MAHKPPSLRDHLQTALSALPNSSDLEVYTLISHPRRTKDLFPHAPTHPRCFQVDYLVLCGAALPPSPPDGTPTASTSQAGDAASSSSTAAAPITSAQPPAPVSGAAVAPSTNANLPTRFVFTSAISAHLYILPHSSSALLYISKVDSSTHGPPLPLTRTLITAFMSYHLLPSSRPAPETRIHLFARSQGQYLFPNSADGGKKTLGGLRLCGWWKGVYEDAARQVLVMDSTPALTAAPPGNSTTNGREEDAQLGSLKLEYLLPSYSAPEAAGMLGLPRKPLPPPLQWEYAHPFSSPLFTSPLSSTSSSTSGGSSERTPSLAFLLPSLPDDPKTRFLAELVDSEPFHLPAPANPPLEDEGPAGALLSPRKKRKIQESKTDELERQHSAIVLAKTSPAEFWERMGWRQEMAIDVTGFFGLSVRPPSASATPMGDLQGQGINGNGELGMSVKAMPDPTSAAGAINHQIVERLHQALLNTDFADLALAIQGSATWAKTARTMVVDEIGVEGWESVWAKVPAKDGVTGASAGGGEKRKEEAPVTMLQVRKKKKVV